jgi:hypothetical protein
MTLRTAKQEDAMAEDAVQCEPFSLLSGIFTGKFLRRSGVQVLFWPEVPVRTAVSQQFLDRICSTGRESNFEDQGSLPHSSGSLEFLEVFR